MNKGYALMNGRKEHRLHPTTFNIPSDEAIRALGPGDYVKICVRGPDFVKGVNGERFWVRLTDVFKVTRYLSFHGIVEQVDMVFAAYHGVKHDDKLRFQDKHVLAIMAQSERTNHGC